MSAFRGVKNSCHSQANSFALTCFVIDSCLSSDRKPANLNWWDLINTSVHCFPKPGQTKSRKAVSTFRASATHFDSSSSVSAVTSSVFASRPAIKARIKWSRDLVPSTCDKATCQVIIKQIDTIRVFIDTSKILNSDERRERIRDYAQNSLFLLRLVFLSTALVYSTFIVARCLRLIKWLLMRFAILRTGSWRGLKSRFLPWTESWIAVLRQEGRRWPSPGGVCFFELQTRKFRTQMTEWLRLAWPRQHR